MAEQDFCYTGYNKNLVRNAKILRRKMTNQERKLWHCFLKNCTEKWYRQRPVDRYIVDFYCSEAKLVLELDGAQHYTVEGEEYDEIRTEILDRYGLQVVRFTNAEIDANFNGICYAIEKIVHERSNFS